MMTRRRPGADITNTVASPDRCPPARHVKRPRLSSASPAAVLQPGPTDEPRYYSLAERRRMTRLYSTQETASRLEWLDYKHEGKQFCSAARDRVALSEFCPSTSPFCIEAFNQKPLVAIGFEEGDVVLLGTGAYSNDLSNVIKRGALFGHSAGHHANSIFDLSLTSDDRLLASSSDLCVKIYDCERNAICSEFMAGYSGSVKQIKFHPTHQSLLISSSRSGEINLLDLRDPTTMATWKSSANETHTIRRAHDIKSGKMRRSNVSVTSIAWGGDHSVISAGEADSFVKFWDMRRLVSRNSQTPTDIVCPSGPSNRHFGITSLVTDYSDNKVWAMCRNGTVYSYYLSAPHYGVIDQLTSDHLAVSSFYCKMALVEPSHRNFGSYLACGGENGVVLFSKPHALGRCSNADSVLLENGHSKEVTSMAFQRSTGSLMSISDDQTLRFWERDSDLYAGMLDRLSRRDEPDDYLVGWAENHARMHDL